VIFSQNKYLAPPNILFLYFGEDLMKRIGLLFIPLLLVALVAGGQLFAQNETPKTGGTLRAAWDAEW
jgi:hypothetical protein